MKYRELIEQLDDMSTADFANYIYDNTKNMINTDDCLYGELLGTQFECVLTTNNLIEYFHLEDRYNEIKDDNDKKYDFMEELSKQYQMNEEEIDKHFIGADRKDILEELKYQLKYELGKDLEDEI